MAKRKLYGGKEQFDMESEALSLSWKDELIVVVLLFPIPVTFLSTFFTDETIHDAWNSLALMPDWYQNILMIVTLVVFCLLYTSPSPRDGLLSRMPSSA